MKLSHLFPIVLLIAASCLCEAAPKRPARAEDGSDALKMTCSATVYEKDPILNRYNYWFELKDQKFELKLEGDKYSYHSVYWNMTPDPVRTIKFPKGLTRHWRALVTSNDGETFKISFNNEYLDVNGPIQNTVGCDGGGTISGGCTGIIRTEQFERRSSVQCEIVEPGL